MSGSTTVLAATVPPTVSFSSPSMVFGPEGDESGWHRSFRKENQPAVDGLAPQLEAVVAARAKGIQWTLAPHAETLPEAWSWADPDYPMSPEVVCAAGPCRIKLEMLRTGYNVEVAATKAPSAAARRAMRDLLEQATRPADPQ